MSNVGLKDLEKRIWEDWDEKDENEKIPISRNLPYSSTPLKKPTNIGTSYGLGGSRFNKNSTSKKTGTSGRKNTGANMRNKTIDNTKKAFGKDFEKQMVRGASFLSRLAWVIMSNVTIFGMIIGASIADLAGGAIALSLIFTNADAFSAIGVGTAVVATGLSMVTSGIQILLLLEWTSNGLKKMNLAQSIAMFGIMIGDTLLDATVPYYLSPYAETPLNIQWWGKPPMFYIGAFIFVATCFFSERILLWVAKKNL